MIGASMGGLLAARALADAYELVTIVERDALPEGATSRRAVPQGRHVHALPPGGLETIEGLLPGIGEELVEAGAHRYAPLTEMRFSVSGHELARVALDRYAISASRPLVEAHVRRRVLALPNVELRPRTDTLGLATTPDRSNVNGVRLLARADGSAEEALAADLVVAATGRSARVPAWLETLGYERPAEERLDVGVGYASRSSRLPPDAIADKLVLTGPRPGLPRGFALFAQEGDRWLVTLSGYGGHAPPTDAEGFDAFMETVAPADLLPAMRAGEPIDAPVPYRFPANQRRRYERMRRFPERFLLIGDAICSFNPIYGQGMTVAALEADALRRCVAAGPRRLTRRYFRAAARIIDHAWQLATGADLSLPAVEGPRPRTVRAVNAYMERLQRTAERGDPEVTAAFMEVLEMLKPPPHVLRPSIARRVLSRRRTDSIVWPGAPLRTPLRRRTLTVDGVLTPLREAGSAGAGEAVVFMHGNPGSGADFEPLVAAAGARARAVAWDAPGFGHADEPADFEQTVEGQAAFIGRALDELGVARAHLVLHDFGGPWGLRGRSVIPNASRASPYSARACSSTTAGTRSRGSGRRPASARRSWRRRPDRRSASCCDAATRARCPCRSSTGCTTTLPGDAARGAEPLPLGQGDLRRRPSACRLAAAIRDPRACDLGRPRSVPRSGACRAPARGVPGRQRTRLEQSGHWMFVDAAERVEELLDGFLARRLNGETSMVNRRHGVR